MENNNERPQGGKIQVVGEQEEVEALVLLIEELQGLANKTVRRRGLKGDEFHPLNIIDLGLFGLLMQAKVAAGMLSKKNAETTAPAPQPDAA